MDHSKYKMLNSAVLFFFGVIFLVMLGQWMLAPGYRASNSALLASAMDSERWVLPHELHGIIESGQLEDFLMVDLRTNDEFNSGTLPGAVNIPLDRLLEKKSRRLLKKGKPLLLFSDRESLTSIAGILLNSLGYERVYVMANDYTFAKENVLEMYVPAAAHTKDEKARFDYNRFFRTEKHASDKDTKPHPKIIETEIITVGGGC